ncbi:hypothetical protein JAAARDRAFT_124332 [Jaapia argillacea MUCL 33604]|uniref:Holocytochrome c-type synthase n=1 Tax=Jaapia argillacea MUCL 33604 TaxID=933084 RepID=A0A067QDE4_9AGAM|nr:hypothetical protein JAAARDRAFT_124332 [Jaapia argillacea MUCL 33604]
MASCPVDHGSATLPDDKCPVDHNTRSNWSKLLPSSWTGRSQPAPTPSGPSSSLSDHRETSSIPKVDGAKWVYPSESQFFAAMARKNHDPQAADMKYIVPIHNAVNERAWEEVMKWEAGRGGDACGGVKLVSFKGKPSELSIRARWKSLIGYSPPFDRHDWIVERCGTRIRYIIDFYTGRNPAPGSSAPSFFLDTRPALDNWEGVKMRMERFWERWVGTPGIVPSASTTAPSTGAKSSAH